ncbi:hypothetical protein [Agrobacterium cavarae]|uniref:hypothetical protein n=1 Tax=Agrobacterium cavarae TaxID=2528239 RepID=UPI002FF57E67
MTSGVFPALPIKITRQLAQSQNYIASKHNQLAGFDNVEQFALDEKILDEEVKKVIEFHLIEIRTALASYLWKGGVYIGVSILDEFVLEAAKSGNSSICDEVVTNLKSAGVDRSGFVLYPLTEFGLELEIFGDPAGLNSVAIFKEAGFAVAAQANTQAKAFSNVARMVSELGITSPVDKSAFLQYAAPSHLKWLTLNPLLLVKISSHTGDYYENQFIYTLKIRLAAAQVVMLHALSVDAGLPVDKFQSSADISNFETLDIRHYLIGEATKPAQPLNLRRVPMNVSPVDLARLSDLAVKLSTKTLALPEFQALEAELAPVLKGIEEGYLRYINLKSKDGLFVRVYKRLAASIDWYRQSFGSRTYESEAVVALAVAFETLLTDHYAPGGAKRIQRRVGICLKGDPRVEAYKDSVLAIYHARSKIVHTGDAKVEGDIAVAQAAFAKVFLHVASLLRNLSRGMNDPIRELLGDQITQDEIDAKAIAAAQKNVAT